jgi:RES domain-containing protein
MIVYRLSRSKYSHDLSGKGAELAGGRWNSKGTPMIYTSQNISLCMAEVAVHIPFGIIPVDYELITMEIPDDEILELRKSELPKNWKLVLAQIDTQKIGDQFYQKSEKLVLKVPSVIVEGEFNFLINPNHKNSKKVKIKKVEPFAFDARLFVR